MTGFLYHLGRTCSRHRLPVLAIWLVLAVGLVLASAHFGSQASDNVSLPGTGSQQVTDLLQRGFPAQANGSSPIVLRAPQGRHVADYKSAIDDSVKALQANPLVAKVISPLDQAGAAQVSRDGTVAFISMYPAESLGSVTIDKAQGILDDADAAKHAGLSTSAGGPLGSKLSKPATESSEVVGLTMALIVLLPDVRHVVAMGLPILSALIGAGRRPLRHHAAEPRRRGADVGADARDMLGLGVGIDYALFIVTRIATARARDGACASRSRAPSRPPAAPSLFAGTTVVDRGLLARVAGIPLVTQLGYDSADGGRSRCVAAVTLLPAILSPRSGRASTRCRVPGRDRAAATTSSARAGRASARVVTATRGLRSSSRSRSSIPLAIPALSLTSARPTPARCRRRRPRGRRTT